jgi:hypothetical protein
VIYYVTQNFSEGSGTPSRRIQTAYPRSGKGLSRSLSHRRPQVLEAEGHIRRIGRDV